MILLPDAATHMRGKKSVNQRIGSAVKGGHALDESRYCHSCLVERNKSVHLEQIPYKVGTPAEDEHCCGTRQ